MTDRERLPTGRVAVVGPGRVGTVLAAALIRAGHRVVAVTGGSAGSRERFVARFAGCRAETEAPRATRAADLVLVTPPDDVLGDVVTAIAAADGFAEGQHVVHTSGAHGLAALDRAALAGARTAACHPAQTVPTGEPDLGALVGAAWGVTARSADRGWAHDLVEQLGGTPYDVPEDRRVLYHAGLAVASNGAGAAVSVARRLLLAAGLDAPQAFLAPLVDASVANVLARGAEALTGPVVRGDLGTVSRHLAALEAETPELADAYRALTRVVLAQVRPVLADETVEGLERLLGPGPEQGRGERGHGADG